MSTTTELQIEEDLAHTAQQQGRFAESEAFLRTVLFQRLRTLDFNHPDVIRAKNNLAASLIVQHKDLAYAESLSSTSSPQIGRHSAPNTLIPSSA